MRSKHKLILKAVVQSHIEKTYELDCTGMSPDEMEELSRATWVEDDDRWVNTEWETVHSEIKTTLEIVENKDA